MCLYYFLFSFGFNITQVVISRLGFEGWIWILIATVPDICILFYTCDVTAPTSSTRPQCSANTLKAQCERHASAVHAVSAVIVS